MFCKSIETNWIETYLMHLTIFGEGRKNCDYKWTKRQFETSLWRKRGKIAALSVVKHNLIFIERCENEFIESLFSAKLCVLITQIGLPQKKGCKEQRKQACNIRK